jgi:NAD(P)-dependent dehydrogenase (short-subunit alcohol dehydrogenase family)
VKLVDLASLASVRNFAEEINATEPKIDVLINNAGLGFVGPRKYTEDGLEYSMATNHFGHFLLTNLLLGEFATILDICLYFDGIQYHIILDIHFLVAPTIYMPYLLISSKGNWKKSLHSIDH